MKTKIIIAAICLLPVMAITYMVAPPFLQFRFPSRIPGSLPAYNFCSLNINALRYFEPKTEGVETILHLVETNSIDVLCLQELDCYKEVPDSVLQDKLHGQLPYFYKNGGVVIASKYPVENAKRHWFKSTLGTYVYCDLIVKKDTVRLFNLHLQTTGINNARNQFTEKQSIKEKLHIINERMDLYEDIRWSQAQAVVKDVSKSPYPVIILGDFNSHPMSRIYKLLCSGMKDSFVEKGSGFGSTYRGLKGVIRTDYILHDKSIKCRGYKRIKDNISDHYAIVSSLDFGLDE